MTSPANQIPEPMNLGLVPRTERVDGARNGAWDPVNFPAQLPVFDLLSDAPLPELSDSFELVQTTPSFPSSAGGSPAGETQVPFAPPAQPAAESFWFDGDVLMCGCPDCRAPMSVRLWLMIADCWQCGTSIELSEEQEREVQRLLDQREKVRRAAAPAAEKTSEPRPTVTAVAAARKPAAPAETQPLAAQRRPDAPASRPAARPAETPQRFRGQPAAATDDRSQPQRTPASSTPIGARARIRKMAHAGGASVWFNDLFKVTPAWLVSLVLHFVALTLLALFNIPDDDRGPLITLSTTLSHNVNEGGVVKIVDPKDEVHFDLPLPANTDLTNDKIRDAMIRADQDARELRIDPKSPDPKLPDLQRVKDRIHSTAAPTRTFAARDPRVRVEIVQQEGGTTMTEAAVSRGLRWLANHQNADGSWSLHAFNRTPGCNCGGTGGSNCDAAGTSLALLPFLGAGQTKETGRYQSEVSKGLRWMIAHQKPDGDLRAGASSNDGMYAQGQATIVLCEAFAMEGDEELRGPAQKAVDFIVAAQHRAGGWRYEPGQEGDTSVVGWQLMALQSARAAGLNVPEDTLKLAGHYLDTAQSQDGARYSYQPKQSPTEVMTAEGLLCRIYLGWKKDTPPLLDGADWLAANHLPERNRPNIYYWYYGTQTMHHLGGANWEQWNNRMRDILVNTQETSGHAAGSWPPMPGDQHASRGGRIYVTALAVCTLEVYYRHLPIFKQIDLE